MRVLLVMSAVVAVMFGTIAPNATAAVRVNRATCPASIQPLPADGVQHAADEALAAAAKLYPGINTKGAEAMAAARSAFAGVRGQQVTAMCGSQVAGRTVVVQMLFPAMLPSASLSQSVVFAGRFADGYRVWFVAH
jgi:hypothetical protein